MPIDFSKLLWKRTDQELPEEGVVVTTKIEDSDGSRNVQDLKRSGKLWWLSDGSMYVYYTPTHWKRKINSPA